jgi:hypothetical protein
MVNLRATSFATLFSIPTLRLKRSLFFGLLCALWSFPATVLAQDADASAIREHLEDLPNLARNHGFVFVGNISSLHSRPQARCASGVEHRFAYTVTDPLWADPDSLIAKDYVVEIGYIDVSRNRWHLRSSSVPRSSFTPKHVQVTGMHGCLLCT